MIIELLKKKIPVVFITGRGETGLNYLKKDIYNKIIDTNDITANDIKRIYVLTNDGARLFYSTNITFEKFLSQNEYITTNEGLEQLREINDIIKKIHSNYFDVTY